MCNSSARKDRSCQEAAQAWISDPAHLIRIKVLLRVKSEAFLMSLLLLFIIISAVLTDVSKCLFLTRSD